MIIKLIYTLFLGLLLAIFVGVGIEAFYPGPKVPELSESMTKQPIITQSPTPEQIEKQEAYDREWKTYRQASEKYNRNVAAIVIGAAIILLIIGLTAVEKIGILSDGFVLGSVFTLLYAIGRGLGVMDDTSRFLVVTAGLVIALTLGYVKFIRPQAKH